MPKSRIELHARQGSDLASLRALQSALERRGEQAELTAAPGLSSDPAQAEGLAEGPISSLLRVMVAGPPALGDQSSQRCAIIVDEIAPPWQLAPSELGTADLVFVPGTSEVATLQGRGSGEVIATGLARLDELVCDPTGSRARARARLYLSPEAEVLLYAPSEEPWGPRLASEIARLPASGLTVLVVLEDDSEAGLERWRELAARNPGLALPDGADASLLLAACDVVVSDRASLLYEAAALGRGAVRIVSGSESQAAASGILDPKLEVGPHIRESEELAPAVRSALPGSSRARQYADARARCRTELLVTEGSAAERMTDRLCEHLAGIQRASAADASPDLARGWVASPGFGPRIQPARPLLEGIEAQLAFGDADGARQRLVAQLGVDPSPSGYRLLASIHRREGDTVAALEAIRAAEQLARQETADALCERGRVLVDSDQVDAAREAFEEARSLAPDLVDPMVGLGSLSVHAGDAMAGEEYFRNALAREKSPRTLTGLGLALLLGGRAREALLQLEQALDIQADNLSAVYGIVQAGFQTGELAIAERRVRAFVELHSGNLDLLFTLAGLRCELGNRSGSLEMIDRIELFDPNYPGLQELRRKLNG